LLTGYRVSRPVAAAWPMLLVVLYLAVGIEHLKDSDSFFGRAANWLNTVLTFHFLGYEFDGHDVFRLELVGYLAALGGYVLVQICASRWASVRHREIHAKSTAMDSRLLLQETITSDGPRIPLGHLLNSLEDIRDD